MKAMVHRLYANPKYAKAFHWGKLLTITGSAQIIIQIIGFVSGVLIIRMLSTHEYALYTIANAVLGTMLLFSDGGISAGVISQGGKVWTDRSKLGSVMVTGLALRKKTAGLILLIAVPALIYLLLSHGASLATSILIGLSLIPVFFAGLSDSILEVPLKLKQAILPLQINQIEANIGRLFLTGLGIFIFPLSYIALLAGGLPRIYANYRLYKKLDAHADLTQKPNPDVQKEILTLVKGVLPSTVYYGVSGQITIWLISLFGTTAAVAQVGALSRLTMLFSIVSVLFSTLVVPRFARLPGKRQILISKFLQIQATIFVLSGFIIAAVILFSNQLLFVLGRNYEGLNNELVMMIGGTCLSMAGAVTYSVFLSRGWVFSPVINIVGNLIAQISLIIVLDMTQLKNVLLFSILNSAIPYLMIIACFSYQINSLKSK